MHRVSFPAALDTTVHGVSPAKPGNMLIAKTTS